MKAFRTLYKSPVSSGITAGWIILVIFALVAVSCGAPGSSGSRFKSKQAKNKNTKTESKPEEAIGEFEKKILENKSKAEAKAPADANLDNVNISENQNAPRIPTLREQLNELGAKHETLASKVNTLSADVKDLKNSVDGLRAASSVEQPAKAKAGLAEDNLLESDENSTEPVTYEDYSAAKKKAVVKTNDNSKKVKLTKPKSKSPSAKKKTALKKTVNADQAVVKPRRAEPTTPKEVKQAVPTGDFESAMKLVANKNYTKAVEEFGKVIQNTADPATINGCNYWTGESYFGMKQYDKSIPYFRKVVNSASPNKKPEAMAMMAEAYMRAGAIGDAKREYSELIEKFPKSKYAPRAKKMLQQL